MKKIKGIMLAISLSGIWLLLSSPGYSQSGCFNFNDGTIQNWQIDQLYETSTGNKITKFYSSLVLSNVNNQLYAGATGAPNNYFLIDQSITSADFYFESPDLSNNSNWQNIDGYKIDLARLFYSKCWNPTGMFFAQLQMRVIDTADNNKVKLFAEYSGGNFVFHPMDDYSGKFYQFTWKPSFLSDSRYKVKQIRIRISGLTNGGNECWFQGWWVLDNVCPIKGTTANITVDVPNGGENWNVGSTRYIRWHSNNLSNPVKIEYSTDNGSSYSTIVGSTPDDGSYTWVVPNTPSNQCLVKISDATTGSPFDVSDATFTISSNQSSPPAAPSNLTATYTGQNTIQITWQDNSNDEDEFHLERKDNEFGTWPVIGILGTNVTSYTDPGLEPNTTYYYRVRAKNSAGFSSYSNIDSAFTSSTSNNTLPGTNVFVQLNNEISVTFSTVITAGNTTVQINTSGSPPPSGFTVIPSSSPAYYDIQTTASYSGDIMICIKYDDTGLTPTQEQGLKLQVYENPPGQWKDITVAVDVNNNTICGQVSHLSEFAVMMPGGSGTTTQTISLPQGWSWISFNVQPTDLSIEKVFQSVTGVQIVVNGAGQFYMPGVINNIGQIDVTDGYKVYLSTASQLTVTGQEVPLSTPINLSAGWNFISFLPTVEGPVDVILNAILPQLALVKNDEGKFFIPGVINTLSTLKPGEGYKLYMNADAVFTYPIP